MAEYVSLKEASRRFGYEVSTIRRWLKEERVEGLKGPTENSPWKVSVDSLEQLLRDGASAVVPERRARAPVGEHCPNC